jgi:hypothetical protein
MYAFKSSGIKLRDDHYYGYKHISKWEKRGKPIPDKQRRQNKNGHEMEERFNNSNGHRHVRDLEQPYVRY